MNGVEVVLKMNGDEFGRVQSLSGLDQWLGDLQLASRDQQSKVRVNRCGSPILNGASYEVVARGTLKVSPPEASVRINRPDPAVVIRLDPKGGNRRCVLVPVSEVHWV